MAIELSGATGSNVSKASATDFFGGGSTESIFTAGQSGGASQSQIAAKSIIASNEREINRIRGYKIQLTPADNQRLKKIREKILELNDKTSAGKTTPFDFESRKKLLAEADKIIGKPSADVEADTVLAGLRKQIDDLLIVKLSPAVEKRVKTLETLKDSFEAQINRNSNAVTPQLQVQNVIRQIRNLTPARNINQLSTAERREYDGLVKQVNDHVEAKLLLDSRESIKVFNLQTTINELQATLPEDTGSQPSAAAVSRAYVRLA